MAMLTNDECDGNDECDECDGNGECGCSFDNGHK